MSSIEPELWVARPGEAIAFYGAAFGAVVLHRVGHGDDVVAQLAIGDARFWVSNASESHHRFDPLALGGGTGRMLLVVEDPDAVAAQAIDAGARLVSPVGEEHGWRIGRIVDPAGHEWEIGRPLGTWPP
jgi:PhnB protein